MTPFTLIVAATKEQGIGKSGSLPWRLPGDMAFFKSVTTHLPSPSQPNQSNAVIMGRVTWESIPTKFRPLAQRFNIVISRNPHYKLDGATCAGSLEDALAKVDSTRHPRVFVIGGAQIYRHALSLPSCAQILLTRIRSIVDCDTFFPEIPPEFTRATHEQLEEFVGQAVPQGIQTHKSLEYEFLMYTRSTESV